MTTSIDIDRIVVARSVLEAEFAKRGQAPYDPRAIDDVDALVEDVPRYHDAPRESRWHLYAALRDESLVWRRVDIPADRIVMGPGTGPAQARLAIEAGAYVIRFAGLLMALDESGRAPFFPYFIDREIQYPVVPAVLVEYRDAAPYLEAGHGNRALVYRLLDGYHRTVRMVLRGQAVITAYAAAHADGSPWRGYDC